MTSGIPIRAPTTRRSARHHRPDIGHQSGEPTHNSTRLRFDHRSYARAGKLDRFLTVERHFFVWSDFGEAWRRSAQPPPRPAKTLTFLYRILPFFESGSLACRFLSRFGGFVTGFSARARDPPSLMLRRDRRTINLRGHIVATRGAAKGGRIRRSSRRDDPTDLCIRTVASARRPHRLCFSG